MPPRSFAHRAFPDLGVFRQISQIHRIECYVRRFGALVVAGDAVLVQKRSLSRSRRR